jgi:type IV pilus assembly protein PilQ
MNARLCSLLVAGGVVLAGIQGSLHGAALDVVVPSPVFTLKSAVFLPAPGAGTLLQLAIPGYQGVPRVQVLARPSRIVVDLPGVDRGVGLTRKAMKGTIGPRILRWRVAQYSVNPEMTRVVLEVKPGTQAEVSSGADGVTIALNPGRGPIQARLLQASPAAAQAPQVAALPEQPSPQPVIQTVALPAPAVTPAPAVAAVPPPEPAAPAVAAVVPTPEPAAPAVAALAMPPAAPAPIAPVAQPNLAKATLPPLPPLNAPFQALPSLAVNTLLPATPNMTQDTPMVATPARNAELRKDGRGGRILGDTGARYTGTRMTIDVVGTDLTSFLRIIADTAHLNLIVDQDVQGIYTFKFTDTPWDQVLDVILKHAGLGKEVSNGIIRVAKVEKLQKEEEDRKRLDDAKALSGETQSITRPLSFAKASEAKNILDKVLTKRGSLIIDERTNTLIITDLPRNLPLIDDLIAQLDVQIQQVQIEARVVEATKNWQQAFGVQWPTSNSGATSLTTNGSAATWTSTNGASWNSINNLQSNGSNGVSLGFSPGQVGVTDIQGPAGQFWLSFLSNRMSVNVILQALESQGVVKIISSPKVVTQNNKKAKVLSGQKIPYPAQQAGTNSGAITVSFAEANLSLEVTPQITNDGTILMDIHVEKSDANFSQQVAGTPTITQKLIETQVLVKDGGTAIMGGVYKNTNSVSSTGVPFLSHLPLIGFLFRNKTDSDANDELLVFITPRILRN